MNEDLKLNKINVPSSELDDLEKSSDGNFADTQTVSEPKIINSDETDVFAVSDKPRQDALSSGENSENGALNPQEEFRPPVDLQKGSFETAERKNDTSSNDSVQPQLQQGDPERNPLSQSAAQNAGYQQQFRPVPRNTQRNRLSQNTAQNADYQQQFRMTPRNTQRNRFSQNTARNTDHGQQFRQTPRNTQRNPFSQNIAQNAGYQNRFQQGGINRDPFAQNAPPYGYAPQNANGYPTYPQYYQPPGYLPKQAFFYQPSPKELEKTQLSKDCSTAVKTTIAIFVTMLVVAIIIEIVGVFCGIVEDVPKMDDPYTGFTPVGFYMYEGLASLLSVFFPTLILARSSGTKLNELIPFKKISGKKLLAIVLAGTSLCMVAQIMATLIGINMSLFGIDINEGLDMKVGTSAFDIVMNTICTAIIPALVEEFAYRGLVLGVLKKHDNMLAVFGSAFLFGMLHGNFAQIPFAFVVGLILGYVRVKTDSMLPGILIHFCNNFYAVVAVTLSEVLPESYSGIVDVLFIVILIVIGFIATTYLLKKDKDFFTVETKTSYLTYSEKLKTFMTTGTVIASIILLTIESIAILTVLKS